MSDFDFSCIPCAGSDCFKKPVQLRKACTRETHPCPYRPTNESWKCRCCDECFAKCGAYMMTGVDPNRSNPDVPR